MFYIFTIELIANIIITIDSIVIITFAFNSIAKIHKLIAIGFNGLLPLYQLLSKIIIYPIAIKSCVSSELKK